MIKKVHSPNAMISRLNIIVINAFLSLYIELHVIYQRKTSKNTREGVIKNFQPSWSEFFSLSDLFVIFMNILHLSRYEFLQFFIQTLQSSTILLSINQLKLFCPLPLFYLPMDDRQQVAKCMRL